MDNVASEPMQKSQLDQILNGDENRIHQYEIILKNDLNIINTRLNTICQRWEGTETEPEKVEKGDLAPAPEATITSIRGRFDKSGDLHEKMLEGFKSAVNEIRNKLEILEIIL